MSRIQSRFSWLPVTLRFLLFGIVFLLAIATPARVHGGEQPAAGSVVVVAAGETHTCLLTSEGAVWCWGANSYGQLGDGTRVNRRVPVPVIGLTSGVQSIVVGGHHSCALTANGEVRCWGRSNYGQVGDGTTYLRTQPVLVRTPAPAAMVTAGYAHTCAALADGAVACWGSNTSGQLGDGTTIARRAPVAVSGLAQVQRVTAGGAHTCALVGDGSVRCWGSNYSGQLGDGTRINRRAPVAVGGLGPVASIGAGGSHTCTLDAAGALACWGNNYYGQLGNGTTSQRLLPVAMIGLPDGVQSFSTGLVHTCALLVDGSSACVGWNLYGQLGDGTTTNRSRPVTVSGLPAASAVVAANGLGSAGHTCAIVDGGLACWGKNNYGQLGDNSSVQRTAPVTVVLPTPPPTYAIRGRVLDETGAPLSGVTLAMPGGAQASTDASGVYTLPNLKPGVYAVSAVKDGYRFVPERHGGLVVPPAQSAVDFVGAPVPVETFSLDLPFPYTGTADDFARLVQNWTDGGRTTSWFDHAYPDYSINNLIWTYNQSIALPEPSGGVQANRCAQNVCYDGHNGIDFARNYAVPSGTPILAAADGRVVLITTGCVIGDARCATGWGNQVVLAHTGDTTYFTRYAHLATVDVAKGQEIAAGAQLGMMGTTGNSTGIHLHFGVYRDDGDGNWEDRTYDKPVDPFGWQAALPDPWVTDRGGAVSIHLWRHAAHRASTMMAAAAAPEFIPPDDLVAAAGELAGFAAAPPDEAAAPDAWQSVVDASHAVTVAVPPLAFVGQLSLALEPAAAPDAPPAWRGIGPAFTVQPTQVVGDLAGIDVAGLSTTVAGLTDGAPLSVTVHYAGADVQHLMPESMGLYRWDEAQQQWLALAGQIDAEQQAISASTQAFGLFQVQAPLRCPADADEPDDSYYAAIDYVAGNNLGPRLFDGPLDEDWLRIELNGDTAYLISAQGNSAVEVAWILFDQDGVTPLAGGDSVLAPLAVQPPRTGTFFLRTQPMGAVDDTACNTAYAIAVDVAAPRLFLPLVER